MRRSTPHGMSLLETVIAIGIITMALVGSLALIISTITAGRESANRLLAVNFAREGIEAIRAKRDTNWLKQDVAITDCDGPESPQMEKCDWDSGLTDPNISSIDEELYTGIVFLKDDEAKPFTYPDGTTIPYLTWWFDTSVNAVTDDDARLYEVTVDANTTHVVQYGQLFSDSEADTTHPTPFSRLIRLRPICRNAADDMGDPSTVEETLTSQECNDGAGTKVGIQVVSTVQWEEQGATRTVELEEQLFDWQ